MRRPLWIPSKNRIEKANLTNFITQVNDQYNQKIDSYNQLYNWSIEHIPDFWKAMWQYNNVTVSREYDSIVDDLQKFPGTEWFTGARLNFAENLLRYEDDNPAFIFRGENHTSLRITYAELRDSVAHLSKPLHESGVIAGDRVAAYMPNLIETAVAMIATTSLGAIWSSCGTELGPGAVIDRLGQIKPKVLFTVGGYPYKGKIFDITPRLEEISKHIPSLEKIIVLPYVTEPKIKSIPKAILYSDFTSNQTKGKIEFKQLPFDHPVYIMFSSGTTGKPKCMVQSAGGILINHMKELILHTDLKRKDKIFYISTPSWMMWNWTLSSLAVGATIALYDGNPLYPDWSTLWDFVQEEKITIFGCSASYINYLRTIQANPEKTHDLDLLREISQTGSPLSSEGFKYVYKKIKKDLHLNSISGGTDINGCFAAGTPIQPVYAGELQGPALGMKVKAYDEEGRSVFDKKAELVCEAPSPSMPIYFWNDPDGEKYKAAYFNYYPGVWRHGDWILIHSDTGGITFLGRSDFTLKPSGVRIGPAEIYNVVEKFKEVSDSLAAGQNWKGDQRIILFLKLTKEAKLTDDLKHNIRSALRTEASPRHMPALIFETPAIPYTFSMKKVESAVVNILNDRPVTNKDALSNPEALEFYKKIAAELKKE
ncbi:MAG: acetoacetate--CoA ligase [Candidatus Bathyarchaeota archaeon]|jgi:acetoacetyl-CoA synthetase